MKYNELVKQYVEENLTLEPQTPYEEGKHYAGLEITKALETTNDYCEFYKTIFKLYKDEVVDNDSCRITGYKEGLNGILDILVLAPCERVKQYVEENLILEPQIPYEEGKCHAGLSITKILDSANNKEELFNALLKLQEEEIVDNDTCRIAGYKEGIEGAISTFAAISLN